MTQLHRIAPLSGPPPAPLASDGRRHAGRVPWRAAGIGLTSLGVGLAYHLLGQAVLAAELTAVLAVIGTALFGSQARSKRAFRLLRWAADRPEPLAPASTGRRRP
jgi:hypothetical protein